MMIGMRLRRVTLRTNGRVSLAMWHAEGWRSLVALAEAGRSAGRAVSPTLAAGATDLMAMLAGGAELAAEAVDIAGAVDLDALPAAQPVPGLPFRPVAVRDCAICERRMIDAARGLARRLGPRSAGHVVTAYERPTGRVFHCLRRRRLWHERPVYYKSSVTSFLGDGDTLPWPPYTNALDYELELGLVIARPVRDAAPDTVLAAVGGVVLINDVTARDAQYRGEMTAVGFGPANAKDFATAIGPVVVTADEMLPVIEQLDVAVRVNGMEWISAQTAGMQHPASEVVAGAAHGETLMPGDIVAAGAVPGCSGVEVDRWVSPGDVVELMADRLGTLRNIVGEPEPWLRSGPLDRPPWRAVQRRGLLPDPVRRLDPERAAPAPPSPLSGVWAADRTLDGVERWECPGGATPEDVILDRGGRLYTGVKDGRIHRWPSHYPAAGGRPEVFADTHGRPTGLGLDPRDGTLVVCDAERGLLRVDGRGRVQVLADEFEGIPLRFTNNPAIRADGTVFFSDSSTRFGPAHWRLDLLERRPTGRVFAYAAGGSAQGGSLELLADGLYFPNGVALAPDASYLLVAETSATRVSRLWLAGPRAGQRDISLDNLPAYPDNLSEVGDGTYWMALPSLRRPQADRLMPHPRLRRAVGRLPERFQPGPSAYGLVARVDGEGRVLQTLHGPAGRYVEITGVRQHGGWLYLGSLVETAVARVRLP
jgi:2-keto-4-pentenoate hydratase/2-oxohepta-3-ene-1,7-dioic acid hydratase in catechol pathway/sugar lactone lactonase YvrE